MCDNEVERDDQSSQAHDPSPPSASRYEPAHDTTALTPEEKNAYRAKLKQLGKDVDQTDPRFVRQLINIADADYMPEQPSDPYAHDMSKSGFHPDVLKQIENKGESFVTGVATDKDELVGKLLVAYADMRRVPIEQLYKEAVTNVGGKSFMCGRAAFGKLGSAVSLLCFVRDDKHVLVLSQTPGGDDIPKSDLVHMMATLKERASAAYYDWCESAYYEALRRLLESEGSVLLRWRFDQVAVSILQGSKGPIHQVFCNDANAEWTPVLSDYWGSSGPLAPPMYTNAASPLVVGFASRHVTFGIRLGHGRDRIKCCELTLLALLGARDGEALQMSGFAVTSLKPQTDGDKRAGVDVLRDGLVRLRGSMRSGARAPRASTRAPRASTRASRAPTRASRAPNLEQLEATSRLQQGADVQISAEISAVSAGHAKKQQRLALALSGTENRNA